MKLALLLSLMFAVVACSSKADKKPAPQTATLSIDQFVDNWTSKSGEKNQRYQEQYKAYLSSVQNIFKSQGVDQSFETYLKTINNASELMQEEEKQLPELYKKMKGKTANTSSKEYKLFRTQYLSNFYDKLMKMREETIRDMVTEDTFQKLRQNYKVYNYSPKIPEYGFPL
jgi:hypothetical protein